MVMLSLIAAASCGRHGESSQEDDAATELVEEQDERNELYRLSVIKEEKERERAWRDSVLEVVEKEHDVRYAYLQLLDVGNDEYEEYNYNDDDKYRYLEIGYFLYDITQDGIPEMWVAVGSPACYYILRVYTYRNGKAERVIENVGRDPIFCLNRDEHYVVEKCERDPAVRCDKIVYNEGKFQLIEIFHCGNRYDSIEYEAAMMKYKKVMESTSYSGEGVVPHTEKDVMPIASIIPMNYGTVELHTEDDVMPILKMFD